MYVKLPGGRTYKGGYIVPCEVLHEIKDSSGSVTRAYIVLSDASGKLRWRQWVMVDQLINDDEAERDG